MKKFFTLIAAVAMAASVSAQTTTEWNFTNWEAQTFSATTTKDGLTVYAGKNAKDEACNVVIDANSKTIDGVKYTQRLKFGGTGGFQEDGITPAFRVLEFAVEGPSEIYVALTTSNKTDAKILNIDALETGATEKTSVGTISLDPNEIKGETVQYTGKAGKIFVYPNGGVNVYDLKVTSKTTTGITNVNAASSANSGKTYNLAGQQVSSSYKGLVIKNGKKYVK